MGFFDWIKNTAGKIWSGVKDTAGKVVDTVKNIAGKVNDAASWIGDRVNDVKNTPVLGDIYNTIKNAVPEVGMVENALGQVRNISGGIAGRAPVMVAT